MSASPSVHERSYRALTRLYPRAFRREYGDDLVQPFRDDLSDRGAVRGWGRALSDLVLSVPVQHVEATVSRSSTQAAQAAIALGVVSVLAIVAVGRFVIVGVPVMVVLVGAILAYRRSQLPYREAIAGAGPAWWRLLLAGAAVLVAMGLRATFGPRMDWFPWNLGVLLFLTGWALVVAGAALGALRLGRRLFRRPAGSF